MGKSTISTAIFKFATCECLPEDSFSMVTSEENYDC